MDAWWDRCLLAVVVIWPAIVVWGVAAATDSWMIGSTVGMSLVRGVLFATVTLAPLKALRTPIRVKSLAFNFVSAFFVYVVVAAIVLNVPARALTSGGVAILALAGIEEWVFRGTLPQFLGTVLRRFDGLAHHTQAVAVSLGQISFALAHVNPLVTWHSGAWAYQFLDIVVVGHLYWLVARTAGFGVAIGLHGGLNLVLASTLVVSRPSGFPLETLVWLGLSLLLIRARCHAAEIKRTC